MQQQVSHAQLAESMCGRYYPPDMSNVIISWQGATDSALSPPLSSAYPTYVHSRYDLPSWQQRHLHADTLTLQEMDHAVALHSSAKF